MTDETPPTPALDQAHAIEERWRWALGTIESLRAQAALDAAEMRELRSFRVHALAADMDLRGQNAEQARTISILREALREERASRAAAAIRDAAPAAHARPARRSLTAWEQVAWTVLALAAIAGGCAFAVHIMWMLIAGCVAVGASGSFLLRASHTPAGRNPLDLDPDASKWEARRG